MPAIALHQLTKTFAPGPAALDDISLTIPDRSWLAVVGPSGAGKSTLLRLLAGLETPSAGRIEWDGRDVTAEPPHRRGVAWLSQRPALYGHLDVERNLMIGWEMGGGRQAEARLRANEAAEWLGIRDLLRRRPGELSGGEEQRVALGRAMVRQARLWLLDEPFAHLDPARSRQLRQDLPLLASRSGATIVSVTHDPVEAALADRLAVLDHGRLVQCDFPGAVWNDPSRLTVATWLARLPLNRLDGSVERRPLENAPGEWQFRDPSGFLAKSWPASPERIWRDGQAVTALVRPEDLVLSPASEPPLVTVIRVEPQWPAWLVVVAAGDWHGVSWWTSDPPPQPGTTWSVQFRRVLWFDEHGQRLTTASA